MSYCRDFIEHIIFLINKEKGVIKNNLAKKNLKKTRLDNVDKKNKK